MIAVLSDRRPATLSIRITYVPEQATHDVIHRGPDSFRDFQEVRRRHPSGFSTGRTSAPLHSSAVR
jgi:hypothetical protein